MSTEKKIIDILNEIKFGETEKVSKLIHNDLKNLFINTPEDIKKYLFNKDIASYIDITKNNFEIFQIAFAGFKKESIDSLVVLTKWMGENNQLEKIGNDVIHNCVLDCTLNYKNGDKKLDFLYSHSLLSKKINIFQQNNAALTNLVSRKNFKVLDFIIKKEYKGIVEKKEEIKLILEFNNLGIFFDDILKKSEKLYLNDFLNENLNEKESQKNKKMKI